MFEVIMRKAKETHDKRPFVRSTQSINPQQALHNPLQTLAIPYLVMKANFEGSHSIVVEMVTQN